MKETPVQPEAAVENGYSQSKWVCEKLLGVIAEKAPLHPVVIRIGQVTGSPSGTWNISEWFPSLVGSSVYLKALPDVTGVS